MTAHTQATQPAPRMADEAPESTMERKILIASLVAAVAAVALLQAYLHRFEREATGGAKRQVVVLTRDLEPGAKLGRDAVGTRELPEAYLESRHVAAHDLDRMIGLALAVPGRAGEALLWTDLASLRRSAPRLSSLVPEGMRAITLKARASGAEAQLEPGDRVDVLSTRNDAAVDGSPRTQAVAEALLVLAVGERQGGVTLAVTPDQGRALAEAELSTSLRLVLRNADEVEE